jgi:colanic acid/amylovoran biosynthesis glycosyltransferase
VLQRNPLATARQLATTLARTKQRSAALWRTAHQRYGTGRRALRAYLLALPFDDFDIVHIEYSGLAVSYRDALPLCARAKLVVSCRGAAEQITPLVEPERRERLREVFTVCDRVHCVSADMQRTCADYGLSADKAFVNRPAIDARRFRRTAPYVAREGQPFRLLTTGRLHWKKGLEYALLAVRELVDAGHDVVYEILGGGHEEERLKFAVHDLGLDRNVSFLGRRSSTEVRAALERADVYLLPSLSEGISNAALEAMAMEVPLVTTSAGGMNEAVHDGIEGMVVPSRDPGAMARRIAELLRDGPRRAALGRAARARIESEFSLERQISVYLKEYDSLLNGAS